MKKGQRTAYGYTFEELHELLDLPVNEVIVQIGFMPCNREPVVMVETEPMEKHVIDPKRRPTR